MGDWCGRKNKGNIRIVTQNINWLGQIAESFKEQDLKAFAIERNIDILGVQESNVCWENVGGNIDFGIYFDIGEKYHSCR